MTAQQSSVTTQMDSSTDKHAEEELLQDVSSLKFKQIVVQAIQTLHSTCGIRILAAFGETTWSATYGPIDIT